MGGGEMSFICSVWITENLIRRAVKIPPTRKKALKGKMLLKLLIKHYLSCLIFYFNAPLAAVWRSPLVYVITLLFDFQKKSTKKKYQQKKMKIKQRTKKNCLKFIYFSVWGDKWDFFKRKHLNFVYWLC